MTYGWLPRRRALSAVLAATLAAGVVHLTSPSAVAEPAPEVDRTSIAPGDPLLDEPQKGPKAVSALGDDLELAADRNELRPAELRTLLRTDDAAWVDTEGLVYFVDPVPDAQPAADEPAAEKIAPLAETLALHSNPGANRTILLDFDGAAVSGTSWNDRGGVTPGSHPGWDPAGDGPAFSNSERLQIQQIWSMVAEDYAPFNVDVTTEDVGAHRLNRSSSADSEYGTRVLITPSDDPFVKLCNRNCGGIAYLGVFDLVGDYYQPAWVFPHALHNNAKYIAEAVSHEAGHNLALQHDGTASLGYYEGHGVWAPIMGVGYNKPLVQWSAGSYGGANNRQDDVSILTSYLGARPDEASDSIAAPAPLPDGDRVIGTRTDVDAYLLGKCSAGSTVTVAPATVGPNLDVRAVLHDASGGERAVSQPTSDLGDGTTAGGLGASMTVPAAGEGWVLSVEGAGQGAWDTNGYDDYASLGTYTVSAPGCDGALAEGAPSEPLDVAAGSAGQDSATFSWSAPSSAGGGPVTGYVVARSGAGASQTLPADARSHTFIGLAPGTTYEFSVRAVNDVGTGPSVTVTVTTAEATPAAPSAPRDMTGSYDHALKQIEVSWVEPASAGTQPISSYAVYFDGDYLGQLAAPLSGALITNPDGFSEGEHTVGIAAVNAVGSSPIATVTVVVDLPDRPANDDVTNAQLLSGTSGSVAGDNTHATKEPADPSPPTSDTGGGFSVWYSWTPSADGRARLATSGGADDRNTTLAVYTGEPGSLERLAGNDDSERRHAAVTFDARAGARYLVAVDGFSSAGGTGPFSLAWDQEVRNVPNAPGGVSASRGDQSATVTWTAPAANGSPITGYVVTTSGGGTKTVDADAVSTTVSGLTNGTAYSFTVAAINAVGRGAASQASNNVIPAGVPSRPTAKAVKGDKVVTLSWAAPPANGSAITKYTIREGTRVFTVAGTATSLKVSSLLNGRAYTFTLSATNAVGEGPVSATVTATPSGRPAAPQRPTANAGKRYATIAWKAPSANETPITSYRVRRSDGAVRTVKGSARSYKWTRLTKGKRYSFKVYAVNQVGTSGASSASRTVRIK